MIFKKKVYFAGKDGYSATKNTGRLNSLMGLLTVLTKLIPNFGPVEIHVSNTKFDGLKMPRGWGHK